MPITDRVKMLREKSLNAKETLSSERAELLTAFYQQETGALSTPVTSPMRTRVLGWRRIRWRMGLARASAITSKNCGCSVGSPPENWTSRPLWERHMESPHLQGFSGQSLPVLEADPYVLRVGDVLYAYATNTPEANLPVIVVDGGLSLE